MTKVKTELDQHLRSRKYVICCVPFPNETIYHFGLLAGLDLIGRTEVCNDLHHYNYPLSIAVC